MGWPDNYNSFSVSDLTVLICVQYALNEAIEDVVGASVPGGREPGVRADPGRGQPQVPRGQLLQAPGERGGGAVRAGAAICR